MAKLLLLSYFTLCARYLILNLIVMRVTISTDAENVGAKQRPCRRKAPLAQAARTRIPSPYPFSLCQKECSRTLALTNRHTQDYFVALSLEH